jgi:hypothetical protein
MECLLSRREESRTDDIMGVSKNAHDRRISSLMDGMTSIDQPLGLALHLGKEGNYGNPLFQVYKLGMSYVTKRDY